MNFIVPLLSVTIALACCSRRGGNLSTDIGFFDSSTEIGGADGAFADVAEAGTADSPATGISDTGILDAAPADGSGMGCAPAHELPAPGVPFCDVESRMMCQNWTQEIADGAVSYGSCAQSSGCKKAICETALPNSCHCGDSGPCQVDEICVGPVLSPSCRCIIR